MLPLSPQRTTPGFAFAIVERSLLECIAVRKFSKSEIAEAIDFFGSSACAYCGATPMNRWDHLVPVSKGGDTVLGNMVPACGKCDDSKRDLSLEQWALGDSPSSLRARGISDIGARLARIREYVAKYDYAPLLAVDRLNEDELRQFELIRKELARVRRDLDAFIDRYRIRTGFR